MTIKDDGVNHTPVCYVYIYPSSFRVLFHVRTFTLPVLPIL
jgi:hypothetical protein